MAKARNIDEDAAEEGAWDTKDGDYEGVAVGYVGALIADVGATRCLDVKEESLRGVVRVVLRSLRRRLTL